MEDLNLLKDKCKDLSILYVEDEEKVRIQTSKVLSIYFNNITLATNGKEALEKLKEEKIDIIFTDINMPKMDGLSMVEQIRKTNNHISVVVFSAYENTEYFLKSIEYGIDGYILKPFKFNQIQKVIEKIITKLQGYTELIHTLKLIDKYVWDIDISTLYKDSKQIELTKNETNLFKFLSSSKHRIYSSQEIEIELFNDNYSDNKRVRGLISRLNKKVDSQLIKSIYGQGYELNLDKK
ncbi:MAG: DNA-binding response regulator [Arcobacter sp.]|nr:MAG: DNA-binding response regulator [Arcobacter sp.]